ncbi:MAG: hypothetical protein A2W93_15545 [Bacteroidetes bacterium GWF2_43_63]|nr:MAG: hypothetical protein A2W94_05315 [Bacteroidetes bacterium GWE2_42_42]OFY53433.1 MAG: hypothetical protein A2W93_15545 [Bacteroidetes bacterium GWF2_43_63]HBG69393.1 hypothetical protein [Bacteroidales bacterium]HCB62012.1 hypothetical protein [Bacteroidales bacterium]HCY23152.1 hypothetical protein [Bacteroidales bacterium]
MRYFSLILLFAIFVSSCSSVVKEEYPDGTLKSEVTMKNGQKNGPSSYYYPNGNIELRMNYADDQLEGQYEKFTIKGTRTELTMYVAGKKNGESKIFGEDGKLQLLAMFVNDTIHGTYKEFYPNGQVKVSGTYNHGFYDGKWEYFDFSGINVGYAEFKNGTGKQFALYYGSKRIKTEVSYVNNQKDGEEIWYDADGKIEKKTIYSDGRIISAE